MKAKNEGLLVDLTLTLLEENNGNGNGVLAGMVQATKHGNPFNRIGMLFSQLHVDRKLARSKGEEYKGYKPERMFSFLQALQNQCIWNATRYNDAVIAANIGDQAVGLDFSADIAEQMNFEPMTELDIASMVLADFNSLRNLHSWMKVICSYLPDIQDLKLYVDSEKNDKDEWVVKNTAITWVQAQDIIQNIKQELEEKKEGTIAEEAQIKNY